MEYKNDKTANRRRYKSRYHSPHNYKTKRSKSENRAAILIGVATFVVLAALILVFTFGDSIYAWLDSTFHPSSVVSDQKQPSTIGISVAATEGASQGIIVTPTETPTDPVEQSADFNKLMTAAGLNSATLGGSQLILVQTNGTNATVYTFEKDDKGVWNQKFSPVKGFTGEGGASETSVPYDSVTPKGTFNIEYAMGVNLDPGTKLSYNDISYGKVWVTDPASINYNRLLDVETEDYVDYETCQELDEYTLSYPYAIIFDYNRNPVDGSKGCAKFLHVSDHPTYGGVGIAESDLYNILMWLDPVKAPQISIF